MEERRANRLLSCTSPYLKQHAYNPVDWYPWGPEALERSRRENKPIFLSIGYSTCHWCHVMAHHCFENPAIAGIMNANFINIKVDREERPDLDETYMSAVQALTGRGGWPLSVFLTPELQPFYGGTYFPPEDQGGLPGFRVLLLALTESYRTNREKVADISGQVQGILERLGEVPPGGDEPDPTLVEDAAYRLFENFDPVNGGFGNAPKFPRSLEFGFLFTYYHLSGKTEVLGKLAFTLEKMARGGIYDQLGGGFHRYSVDEAWLVPHFEKMLYDNALLPPLYLALHQLTGNGLARRIAVETLDFVLKEMQAPGGGFYAAWDADSEGVEGKYYVFTYEEVEKTVGSQPLPLVAAALGISPEGNLEGANVLSRPRSVEELAAQFSLTPEQVAAQLEEACGRLRAVRAQRVLPHRDEKIIVSWNGLMISALALGAQVLGDRRYYEAAAGAARFILTELLKPEALYRIWSDGRVAVPGFSEDYTLLAQALLDLYETDFNPQWLEAARQLWDRLEEKFLDESDGLYFFVARDQEAILQRSKSLYDQTNPSGNSMAARVGLRLHRLTEEPRYRDRALNILRRLQPQARQNPWALSHFWTVATIHQTPPLDLTLVGDPGSPLLQEMVQTAYRHFLPERRLVLKNPADCAALEDLVPSARTYGPEGEGPTAYLCHHFACQPAIKDAGELARKLAELKP